MERGEIIAPRRRGRHGRRRRPRSCWRYDGTMRRDDFDTARRLAGAPGTRVRAPRRAHASSPSAAHDGPLVVQKALLPGGGRGLPRDRGAPAGRHRRRRRPRARRARAGAGAHALLTTPGAGKWYRSAGAWARQPRDDLRGAAARASSGCRRRRSSSTARGPTSAGRRGSRATRAVIAWEILCLARTGSRRALRARERRALASRLFRDGRARCGRSAALLEPGSAGHGEPGGAARGAASSGTMLAAGIAATDELLAALPARSRRGRRGLR